MESNTSFLQFGDRICLFSDIGGGFLSASGINHPNFYVPKTADEKLALVPNQRHMVYQVLPKLNYNLSRDYDKLQLKIQGNDELEIDLKLQNQLKKQLEVLEERKNNEGANNELLIASQIGNFVYYGNPIQLKHEASGEWFQLSKKSAEEDKTCQKIELTGSPVASRCCFKITPRYQYRQEGDRVVFRDQILLFNQKANAYVHFTKDDLKEPKEPVNRASPFRETSPLRRRNPENIFNWYEANMSQNNFEKWTILAYRHCNMPAKEESYLHGGDCIRIKHAESGGYLTVDENYEDGQYEAYIRVHHGDSSEEFTTNQMFELEKSQDEMEESGTPLMWEEERDTNEQTVSVRLRHFNSGRLLQIMLYKDKAKMKQVLTLAKGQDGKLEHDGEGISAKKVLKKGGRIQNYIFKLTNRATVDELTLTTTTVCNIKNDGTKTFISTQIQKDDGTADVEEEEQPDEGMEVQSDNEIGEGSLAKSAEGSSHAKKASNKRKSRMKGNVGAKSTVITSKLDGHSELDDMMDEIMEEVDMQRQASEKTAQHVLTTEDEEEPDESLGDDRMTKDKIYRKNDPKNDKLDVDENVIRLKAIGDMNDVFVPKKCDKKEIDTVLFIQSAVPKIKEFLHYNRFLKTGREKLNLPFCIEIQNLLKRLIFFVIDEKNHFSDPFIVEGTPIALRQKCMRECRFIDLIIDCLVYPFSYGYCKIEELTLKHPITRICKLCYRLLKHCVQSNYMNKNYVAQWIDLFFTQAMITTEANSFGAEVAINELITNNFRLLENSIKPSTVENLVELCLQQQLNERFLTLLSNLCQCNGRAVSTNQDSVFDTMLEKELEERDDDGKPRKEQALFFKKGLFFPMETKRDIDGVMKHFVVVKDDTIPTEKKTHSILVENMFNFFQEKGDMRLYNYFQALIRLSASICLARAYKAILFLENIYTLEQVIDCVLNVKIPPEMRANFAKLLIHLHLDKDPLEKLVVPVMTRVWEDVENEQMTIPKSSSEIPDKLLTLKPALQNFILSFGGIMKSYESEENLYMLEALRILETMIELGFYQSEKELIDMSGPLISILNGIYDYYAPDEIEQHKLQVEEDGEEKPLRKQPDEAKQRYENTPQNVVMMDIKNKIVDIFSKLMQFQNNARLTKFLIMFCKKDGQKDRKLTKYYDLYLKSQTSNNPKQYASDLNGLSNVRDDICENINDWIKQFFSDKSLDLQHISLKEFNQDLTCILLDINLYKNPVLVSNVFKLLISNFTQKQDVLELAQEVQILQNEEEIAILNACVKTIKHMNKVAENSEFWMGKEDDGSLKIARDFVDKLTWLIELCIHNENRVLDIKGTSKKDKKKGKQDVDKKEEVDSEFEILNLSEFEEEWDDEDMQVCTSDEIPDGQNQRLLKNLNGHNMALQIIEFKQLSTVPNQTAYLKVLEKAYIFLIRFVRMNPDNSNTILEHIEDFYDDLGRGVHAIELIKEIFDDNVVLLTYPMPSLVKRLAYIIDNIDIKNTKKATLISFMPRFMQYKGAHLKSIQNLILQEFTASHRKNLDYLYVGEEGIANLELYMKKMEAQYLEFMGPDSKLVAEIEVPPEMSYTMCYMTMFAHAGMGKNAQCETRAQAKFPMEDLIKNMKLADFCYPLKSAILQFVQHIYLDIEKDIGEDFIILVWQLIELLAEDMEKFVEVMQRQKRGSKVARDISTFEGSIDGSMFKQAPKTLVDVNRNFDIVTNFGRNSVSELMRSYVFESIFQTIEMFFSLQLQVKNEHRHLIWKLITLSIMSFEYKSKPIHEKRISTFMTEIRQHQQLMDISEMKEDELQGAAHDEEQTKEQIITISQAAKLKIFMQTCKSDRDKKKQVNSEFEELVLYIINIDRRSDEAFQGANTIQVNDFIESLIQSSDVTSDISCELRTQSLTIIRKIIESENKNKQETRPSSQWDSSDWDSYAHQIYAAQDMLNKLNVVGLLSRLIEKETKKAILEEALLVAIAVLLGGNNTSQMHFHDYIKKDSENAFLQKISDMLGECFDSIKKSQVTRNTKLSKIILLDQRLEQIDQDDEEALSKIEEQKRVIMDDIKVTEYVPDEDRIGEAMSVSRALDTITIILRFLQLLCENHNIDLQNILNCQMNEEGRRKTNQVNIVQILGRMFDAYQKIINAQTIQLGNMLVDVLTEAIQGPCKVNQTTLKDTKILDSSREYISNFDKPGLEHLGFVSPDDDADSDEEDPIEILDEFISKIATMLTSLLEGEEDMEILSRMNFSLDVPDLKNRMLNVFGNYLKEIKMYPTLGEDDDEDEQTSSLSEKHQFNFLMSISSTKLDNGLKSDSFDTCIAEAFEIYILIEKLSACPAAAHHKLKTSFTIDQYKVFDFLKTHTGRIEVARDGNLQRVYFPIKPTCKQLTEASKDLVMADVKRDSQQLKVQCLMEWVPRLMDEMEHGESLRTAPFPITPQTLSKLKDFSSYVGLIISGCQLFSLTRTDHYSVRSLPEEIQKVVTILGVVQGTSSGILIILYIMNKFTIFTKDKWRGFITRNKVPANPQRLTVEEMSNQQTHLILMRQGPDAAEFHVDGNGDKPNFGNKFTEIEFHLMNIYFFLQDNMFRYYCLYFGISLLGFFSDELYYSLHLLDVVVRFPMLTGVIESVTSNSGKLLSTGLLAMVIIYIYTTITFFYLQDTLYDYTVNGFDSDWVGENFCESMIQCYMTIIDKGLLLGGGIGDYTEAINYRDQNDKYFVKLFHDATFHILVNVILLNILFGIIIDTFAQLREQKKSIQMDKKNFCYICNIDRATFDKEAEGGMSQHINQDHDLWKYVFYIVHLEAKDPTEMTGIESYVFNLYKADDVLWMPRSKALCLQIKQEDEGEEAEMQKLQDEMDTYSSRFDQVNERLAKLEIMAQKKQSN